MIEKIDRHCPHCGQPLDLIAQPSYCRNPETRKLQEDGYLWMATCWFADCVLYGYTVSLDTLTNRKALLRYGVETPLFDVMTGRAFESWEMGWWHSEHAIAFRKDVR
jgi:hypothetical protein